MGVAVAPVPDQRLYDTIYQERCMGPPDDNLAGYLKGSASISPLDYVGGY